LNSSALSAHFIAKYLATRLIQRFPLRRLVFNILKEMEKAVCFSQVYGFKIECNGRFERRGRATHI